MNTDSGTYKFSKSMIRKITYQQIRHLKVSRYDGNLVIEDLNLDLIGGEEMIMKEYKEEFGYWEGDEFLIASNAPSFEDFFMDNVHHFLVNNQDKLVKSNP